MIVSHCLLCALSATFVLSDTFVLSVNSPKINIKGSKQSQIVGSNLRLEAPAATKWDFKLFLSSSEKKTKSHNAGLILLGPFHQFLIMGIYLIIYMQNDPTGQSSDHSSNQRQMRRTEDFLISSLQTHFSTTAGQIHHWAFSADMLIDPLLTINTWQYIHELCEDSK